ncbi:MAG: carboxypeptidase-like regulatory domain-containing protein, partial [Odoribacter sp.]
GIQTTRQSAERVLKGHIMDEDKNPLPGVTIMIEGTHLGCSTDVNGDYSLMIPDKNAKLIFSCVGMKNQEITVTNQEILNVIMRASAEDLEEVVVTGYSTRKVSEMTGSAQQFRGKVLAENAS